MRKIKYVFGTTARSSILSEACPLIMLLLHVVDHCRQTLSRGFLSSYLLLKITQFSTPLKQTIFCFNFRMK